jgi:hypothetical protein
MKSIKPGRGPSAMGAVGSIFGIIFGVFWTIMAYKITEEAPFPLVHEMFPFFGLVFIGAGIVNLIYNAANATGKNRMSVYDITDEHEELDPTEALLRGIRSKNISAVEKPSKYCSSCGAALKQDFKFCPSCGKNL